MFHTTNHYPHELKKLINFFKKMPGVGTKTAERFAFEMLNWKEEELKNFGTTIGAFKENIVTCDQCHALKTENACPFCDQGKRDTSQICVVATAREVYAIEETRIYRGLYHVLGGLLSPLSGTNPHHLSFEGLKRRIDTLGVTEVIIALDSTLEGDTTALFLKSALSLTKTTRLAFGLPMGSSLEFVDGGTLIQALEGRRLV